MLSKMAALLKNKSKNKKKRIQTLVKWIAIFNCKYLLKLEKFK